MKKNIENKKPSFILLIILLGFPQLHEAMLSPSVQNIAQQFAIPLEVAQSVLSVYFISFALGVLFWGYYSDRQGRRSAMLLGFIFYLIGTLVLYLATNFQVFMIGRVIGAFGLATGSVTTQTILREAFEPSVRNKLFSQVSIALTFVPGIGPILGGALVESFGLRALLGSFLLIGILIIGLITKRLPETRTITEIQKINILSVFKRMFTNKNIWIYGFFIAAFNAVMSIYYMEVPILFQSHFGMSLTQVGSFGIVLAIATVFGAMFTQYLLKKHDPRVVILIGNGIMLAGSVIMILVGLIHTNNTIQAYLYIAGMFIVRFGTAVALSNAISLALNGFEDVYGTAGSLLSLGYYTGISGLINLMTRIRTNALTTMPLYFAVLAVLMLILTGVIIKDQK